MRAHPLMSMEMGNQIVASLPCYTMSDRVAALFFQYERSEKNEKRVQLGCAFILFIYR
ncbi:15038_t:CDS:2 [Cetraspora pellucida]|uniref:15038_t:CDS:1 n=1 Tax=Cetraspora pellucida TaxID=1433469 RepID=A0ACA9L8J0_9GLOM|nr:15038_t:CDS:2 [Cetraspora pellucida]